ncbi:type I restriction modification DNA specificity domain protein [Bacteroides fragilis str. S24L15]|uniref:restriction endonuclease subunit S n=1 Tax=Bacteroides fragilis TaxID=817 RepID=UPI00044ACB21|nr:restriction endonuclease subunit S [Bacteroides fragilis]EYA72259.1 type I restriction modification DNA specificity domain protein [Bacteroides fragilis str. S24L15]EYA76982.1 type I restriction modification DNA specificity domain protein [Bacteroides fragilis str. S24L26]EYA81548.1 type I restriction modification DNA specificity domain protein [Bacteroides fragilis str. S24L34]
MANNNENKILNVPNLRFPEFCGEWVTKSINDLAVVIGGGTPDTTVKSYWDGEIQWFTPSEIGKNKYVDSSLRTITEVGLNNSSAKLLPPNTILLSSRATIGECSLSLRECATNQGFQCLVSKKCNVDFLYYLIQTKKKDLIRKSCGSTFLEISANEVRKIQVSVPSDVEQQKIAELLSLIDERIATQNKIIEKYESLIKGIAQHCIKATSGITYVKLGDICQITTGKLDANAQVDNGIYPFFTCAEQPFKIDNFAFDTEALLISGNGANLGYINYYKGKFNAYQRTYVLDLFSENIQYIKWALKVLLPKRIAIEKSSSNTPYIVLSTLTDLRLPIPNKSNQCHIAKLMQSLERKLSSQIALNGSYNKLKQYLLRQMFI